MAVQWLTVHDRLLAILASLPGWSGVTPFTGRAVTGDAPTDYVTVGYAQLEDSGGDFTFERHSDGWGVTEVGSVRCEFVARSGDPTDIAALRVRAFDRISELDAAIRADPTLGVLPDPATCRLVVDVVPAQDQTGAEQRLAFSVEYTATTA